MTSLRKARVDGEQLSSDMARSAGHSGGRPLDPGTRTVAEGSLGHSFADVRIHTDAEAATSASALGARAYTVGRDIFFAAGRYAPASPTGRALLAHELTHVVQQRTERTASQGASPEHLAGPHQEAEREARAAAPAVAAGQPFTARACTGVRLARQEDDEPLPEPTGAQTQAQPGGAQTPAQGTSPAGAAARAERDVDAARLATERLDFARDRIAAVTASIKTRLDELRVKPAAQRPPLQVVVHGLERQLAEQLAERVRLLEQHIPELERRGAAERADQGAGKVSADLAAARRELSEHHADLARLGRVFAPEKGVAFETAYRTKVAGLGCMTAAYVGLGTLRTPAESAAIRREVEKITDQGLKREKPIDLNQFITVMDTAHAKKVAGPRQRARWDSKSKTWTPTLESLLRGAIHPDVPGFYFFGLAPAEAIHSVLIGVSTWNEPARTLWCDQFGCTQVTSTFDAYTLARLRGLQATGLLTYADWDTYVWQVEPPAAASLIMPPRPEAK